MPQFATDDEIREVLDLCIEVCEDRQAQDLTVFDVRGKTTLADYYIFCTGNSSVHLQALAATIGRRLKEREIVPRSTEGTPASRWILIDYNHILIHIFDSESRSRYNVEALLDPERRIYPPADEAAGTDAESAAD